MFGEEPYGNYNRILLSNVLSGVEDESGIYLNDLSWYADNGITLHTGTRVARVDALLARRGLVAILASRLVPVLPFTGINYAAGLTAIRLRDFVLGTAIGIVPGTVAYVALGAYGTSPTSWPFVTAVAALLVLSLGGVWVASRRSARHPIG
jgi:uncharacterized membrane protein YdjX (TVP38/TMEM64 family)